MGKRSLSIPKKELIFISLILVIFICMILSDTEVKILVNYDETYTLKEDGCLADIVPTLIEIMGKEQPVEMTGKSLLV